MPTITSKQHLCYNCFRELPGLPGGQFNTGYYTTPSRERKEKNRRKGADGRAPRIPAGEGRKEKTGKYPGSLLRQPLRRRSRKQRK